MPLSQFARELKKPTNNKLLILVGLGLEREVLRIDKQGTLSSKPRPKAFGSPLVNERITLDFSESQLELTTPPLKNEVAVFNYLKNLQTFVGQNLGSDLLWPFSTPSRLPPPNQIPLANFGSSAAAVAKRRYRQGLAERYGGAMQTISGIHFNFSFTDEFWQAYAKLTDSKLPWPELRDVAYFGQMRNAIRFAPLYTYLFGYSPAFHSSYRALCETPDADKKLNLLGDAHFGEFATSLRLSEFGYHNARRGSINVSYNGINEYLEDLWRAVTTPSQVWSALEATSRKIKQLNTNMLQLENEFYAAVRPKQKRHVHPNERIINALACAGVEYVELRIVDLNPHSPYGIELDQLYFLRLFMTWCLLETSPKFKPGQQKQYEENQRTVALLGRNPDLAIPDPVKPINFTLWLKQKLGTLAPVAELLDSATGTKNYSAILTKQQQKISNPDLTPSAEIINVLKTSKNFALTGVALAHKNQNLLVNAKIPAAFNALQTAIAEETVLKQKNIEAHDAWILAGYEDLELSTQILIRSALERKLKVNVLNREQNLIELSRGDKSEIVKQATITSKDSYISYELMSHKLLTKIILDRAKIRVPQGGHYRDSNEVISLYPTLKHFKLVVKPTTTNFGTGVSIVEAHDETGFITAVQRAFKEDSTILVEEFIAGLEYRFLVINDKVIGVLNRDPANVVGDGVHNIAELVKIKNTDPAWFKEPKNYIHLGVVEKEQLTSQGLNPQSIINKNQKVYLRKNSNVSDGGDPLDVTKNFPASYQTIARAAARATGANICGVDMIINNPKNKPNANNHAIIELNYNPAIYLHRYPVKGTPRDVGGAILDFLGF